MAKHKVHGVTYSDLDPIDPSAVAAELVSGVTDACILDNRDAPSGKFILVSMWYDGGGPLTLDEGFLSAGELSKPDLSSLGVAVNRFQISWRKNGSSSWETIGVSALPGTYFRIIGARWDKYDLVQLILIPA